MKKIILILLITFSFLISFNTSTQLALAQNEQIIVIGEGEVFVTPDTAIIYVGVETIDTNLSTAQNENSNIVNNLITILKDNNISENDIKTKEFNIYQKHDYSQGEKFTGYFISTNLEFKTKELNNIGTIINQLIENGVNKFNGINFTLEKFDDAYNQALENALENAKNKAFSLYNKELNIIKIVEEKNNIVCLRNNMGYAQAINEITKFMKGELKINATISVIFENK